MILIDYNQVCIASFMSQVGNHTNMKIDEDLMRHMILNTIRMIRVKFHEQYGEVVVCADSNRYWRREIFPFYKANRKKDRASTDVDWTTLFAALHKVRDELIESFPYKVVLVDGAEADDIIGTLAKRNSIHEKVLIVSSDKDFLQLQKFKNVSQYSNIQKKFIRTDDPLKYISEHILKGDRGDGIPNILSDDDTFVVDKRQKPMRQTKIDAILSTDKPENCDVLTERDVRNYHRNKQLIDLDFIPEDIQHQIVEHYDEAVSVPRAKLLNYFIKHKLRNLTDCIGEF
jgi:hypothetical protein|tara:strand:- start:3856 stop:4713 length:858 start_codon:yes stop_codon:yes gene_type:complete